MNRFFIRTAILLALTVSAAAGRQLSFTDITLRAGTGGPREQGKLGGHAAAFADIDGDHLADLYITMIFEAPMADLFFHNLGGGRFAEEGRERGIDDFDEGSHSGVFADLDNDGDYDLVNGATWDSDLHPAFNTVYRNDGRGRFDKAGDLSGRRRPTRAVLTFDMDGDGDLDIFTVTNYQGSEDPPGEWNELYRNEGGLRFVPVDRGALVEAPCGQGATDTDYDGDIDVFCGNRTGEVNILRNDGGKFTRVPPASIGIRHRAGDGVSTADIDNDGDLDLLLASDNSAALYRNLGGGRFEFQQEFEQTDGYMGGFADLDNDGDLDLVFAGDVKAYLNENGTFRAGPAVPVEGIRDPRGIAFADIDNDGDLDFAIACKRSRNWLLRNNWNSGNWLKVRLVSAAGQAGAFGAKVVVLPLGALREARSNTGYLGQNDPLLHFGLGAHERVDVEVTFLSGRRVKLQGVAANRTVTIRETITGPD